MQWNGKDYQDVLINTGAGFQRDDSLISKLGLTGHFSVDGKDEGLRAADLNGDGQVDLLQSFYSAQNWKSVFRCLSQKISS